MRSLLIAWSFVFGGCATSASYDLNRLSQNDAPYWDVVSLKGLESAILDYYESGAPYKQNADSEMASKFKDIDFDVFKKVTGTLQVFVKEEMVWAQFSSCNAITAYYKPIEGQWSYKFFGTTAIGCERGLSDSDGNKVPLSNPMIVDEFFIRIAPLVKTYSLSDDAKTLNLLGEFDETLGVFSYRGNTR